MDLPKSKLGVDVNHDLKPQYEIVEDKKKMIAELKSSAKHADLILLATDPDREGEAIAANIEEILLGDKAHKGEKTSDSSRFRRIVFHEITDRKSTRLNSSH